MENNLGIGSRVKHHEYGEGVVINVKPTTYYITFIKEGAKDISRINNNLEIIEAVDAPEDLVSSAEIEKTLIGILRRWTDVQEEVFLHNKWQGGKLVFYPADKNLQAKEIPVDTFFHKIVMLRDRLRVMEQRINAHNIMTDEDKINLQQYITKIYGSLTSFNFLFKYAHNQFVGEKTKE
ncbi:MAG: hypothetical protein WCI53_13170 [Bacteroidota bacterium]|jgi:hypothetical protein